MLALHAVWRRTLLTFAVGGLVAALTGCATPPAAGLPQKVAVDALPNGIAVRPDDGAVFITDDRTSSVLASSGNDPTHFAPFAQIPVPAGLGKSLSQLSFARSGALFVERFGFGSAGAIFQVSAGNPVPLVGPDPARRRLGLVELSPGRLLSTWFIKIGNNPPQGALSLVTFDATTHLATERDLIVGLGKPVGIAVSGGNVFVSDQANNNIVKASLADLLNSSGPVTPTVFAPIAGPDLMVADATGRLYTKCNKTSLCEIAPDGTVSVLADDFQEARGVAIDPVHHVLVAVDRAVPSSGTSYLRTFAIK
jgi:DNA-binding beta-propeller fold protein YncE